MRNKPTQSTAPTSYDKWLAFAGIVLGTVLALSLVFVRLTQLLGLAITIQVTCLGYLLLKDHIYVDVSFPAPRGTSLTRLASRHPVLFVGLPVTIVAGIALMAISASANALQRPLWVFLVLAGIPGFILAQKMFFPQTRGLETSLLVQMIMLTITIVLTSVTVFPHNGGDTWAHLYNAKVVSEQQNIQAISDAYRDYPLYPVLISILSTLTGGSAVQTARFLTVFVAVVCLLLFYSLSRQFYTSFESLAMALLLLGSKWFVHWSTLVVSMNMALLFYCLVVVILFRRLHKETDVQEMTALIFVSGLAPFFHPVGAVAVVFLLVGVWAVETFYTDVRPSVRQRSLIGLAIFVVIVTLTQWMYFGDFIFDRTIQSLAEAILYSDSSLQLASSQRDPVVYTLDQLNFYGLLGLAGLEVMRQLGLRTKLVSPRPSLWAGFLGFAFVVFGYGTQAISLAAVSPYRWFLFGVLLLVFPASVAFGSLFRRQSRWVRIMAVGMMVIYTFTGLTNTEVNRDRPLYGKEITGLVELTSSEYAGLLTLEDTMRRRDVNVKVDFRLWNYLKYVPGNERAGYWNHIQLEGFDGVFALRTAYWHRLFLVNGSVSQIDRQHPTLAQFYDSGDMQLLDRVDKGALTR